MAQRTIGKEGHLYCSSGHASAYDAFALPLQERPEDVPTGELPRSVQMVADRHLVGKVAPGTRVTAYGIYSIYQASNSGPQAFAASP